jgi:hypothetical protein
MDGPGDVAAEFIGRTPTDIHYNEAGFPQLILERLCVDQ